jgi:hypothetical protein
MRNTLIGITLAAASGTALAGGGLAIVLDDFDSDPNDEAGGPRSVSSFIAADPYGQPASFAVDTGFSFNGSNGAAVFNSGVGVVQEGVIRWDNNGAGLNFDAAGAGVLGFELDFLLVDLDFGLEIVLETSGGGTASLFEIVSAGADRTEAYLLSDFNIGAGFDASDLDSITITFNDRDAATSSLDFVLTEFRAAVPSPGFVGVLAGAALLGVRRRR